MLNFLKRDNASVKVISVNDMDNLIGKVDLIDIREPYEYNSGSLKSAKNIPMNELLNQPDKFLNKDKEYYIMCQSGGRSSKTCSNLSKQGFKVTNVAGGYGSYVGTQRK